MTIVYNNNEYEKTPFVEISKDSKTGNYFTNRLIKFDDIKKYLPTAHQYIKSSDIKDVVKRSATYFDKNTPELEKTKRKELKDNYVKIWKEKGVDLVSYDGIDSIHTINYNPIVFNTGSILFGGATVYKVETGELVGSQEPGLNNNSPICACNLLPFNTIIQVTNLDNNVSIEVKVTDRGSFGPGNKYQDRIVDVSKVMMEKLLNRKLENENEGFVNAMIKIVKIGDNKIWGVKYEEPNPKLIEPPFPPLEKNKPEVPDWQQQDKTRVKPPTLLEQIKLQQDQMKAIEQQVGNIAPASLESYKSPGPNYKSNRPINNTKFNVDKQLIPVK